MTYDSWKTTDPDPHAGFRCNNCAPPADRTAERCRVCPWADHEKEIAMDEWMPIETHPGDRDRCLLFWKNSKGAKIISIGSRYPSGGWSKDMRPTHWMPLPPPPLPANAFTGTEP